MRSSFSFASAAALVAASFPAAQGVPAPPAQKGAAGGLQREAPLEGEAGSAPAPAFDPTNWNRMLAEPDLDRRERSFDRLVARARLDPAARTYLKGLAVDPKEPELAWTARLALRELERTGAAGFFQSLSLGAPQDPGELLGEDARELLQRFGLALPPDLRDWRADLQHAAPRAEPSGRERSVTVQQGPAGWDIEITEEKDGEKRTRSYKGSSLEAILAQNPELKDDLGITGEGLPGGFRLHLDDLRGGRLQVLGPAPLGGGPEGDQDPWFFSRRAPSEPVRTDILGVRVVPVAAEEGTRLGLDAGVGLAVSSTYPATLAHLLGVRSGDVLVALDGRVLKSSEDITAALEARAPGAPLELVWMDSAGERHTRTWKPEPRGAGEAGAQAQHEF